MTEIKKEEMKLVEGGNVVITAAMISAIYSCLDLFFQIGEALGGYIRRKSEDKMCNI